MLNFIINVRSGKGRGLKVLHKITEHCFRTNTAYSVSVTDAAGSAKNIAKSLCAQGAQTIVAVGGDGTFHEVINGVKDYENVHVGFIAAGRGNDFARAAKINKDPVKALEDILRGETKQIDVLSIGGIRCLNTAGTGIDVEVLQRVEGESGKITYLVSLIRTIRKFKPYRVTTTMPDGTQTSYECLCVGVCNGTHVGGGMYFCPPAKVDDGQAHFIVVEVPANGKIMRALAGFLKGKHINKPYVKHYPCEQIKIDSPDTSAVQLDGEIYEGLDFDCKILKNALTTFCVR